MPHDAVWADIHRARPTYYACVPLPCTSGEQNVRAKLPETRFSYCMLSMINSLLRLLSACLSSQRERTFAAILLSRQLSLVTPATGTLARDVTMHGSDTNERAEPLRSVRHPELCRQDSFLYRASCRLKNRSTSTAHHFFPHLSTLALCTYHPLHSHPPTSVCLVTCEIWGPVSNGGIGTASLPLCLRTIPHLPHGNRSPYPYPSVHE